ncbi:TRAP transporter small permease subunit [Rubrimonas sp.]|uniref:TRAP transporter small permease subunit n=1 Tax=Rubrimonas sp. TaxID=2036015 RepID=UPI002FDE24F9
MGRGALKGLEVGATGLAFVAGLGVLALALLIGFDVVARKLFGYSVQGTDELGGYALAMVGSLGMAHVLCERAFTRIDLLVRRLPAGAQGLAHVAAYWALAGMVLFMAWRGWLTLADTLTFQSRANTPLQTPLWIPQGLWVAGLAYFALAAVVHALRAALLFATAPGRISVEYGGASVEEELEAFTTDRADGRA